MAQEADGVSHLNVGAWRWACVSDDGAERLGFDHEARAWWAMADRLPDTLYFQADRPERTFGKLQMRVQIRLSNAGHLAHLADTRLDVERDVERRGLALSALEQLQRLDVPIALAELRALLDAFIADVAELLRAPVPNEMGPPLMVASRRIPAIQPLGEDVDHTRRESSPDSAGPTLPKAGQGLPL